MLLTPGHLLSSLWLLILAAYCLLLTPCCVLFATCSWPLLLVRYHLPISICLLQLAPYPLQLGPSPLQLAPYPLQLGPSPLQLVPYLLPLATSSFLPLAPCYLPLSTAPCLLWRRSKLIYSIPEPLLQFIADWNPTPTITRPRENRVPVKKGRRNIFKACVVIIVEIPIKLTKEDDFKISNKIRLHTKRLFRIWLRSALLPLACFPIFPFGFVPYLWPRLCPLAAFFFFLSFFCFLFF